MVAWYAPGTRNVRYRSTGTVVLSRAKKALAEFQLPENARTLPRRIKRASNMIYFIGGDTGAIEIRLAREPERKLISLQCGSPIELRVLALGIGTAKDEMRLHKRFKMFGYVGPCSPNGRMPHFDCGDHVSNPRREPA